MPPEGRRLSLPSKLLKQLSGQGEPKVQGEPKSQVRMRTSRSGRSLPSTRKERRKAERLERQSQRITSSREHAGHFKAQATKGSRTHNIGDSRAVPAGNDSQHGERSAPDQSTPPRPTGSSTAGDKFAGTNETSEEEIPRRNTRLSRAARDRLAQDDAEIAELERKLGLAGRKSLPKSFHDDGLGDLLGAIDEDSQDEILEKRKRKAEADDWLAQKRMKSAPTGSPDASFIQTDTGRNDDTVSADDAGSPLDSGEEIGDDLSGGARFREDLGSGSDEADMFGFADAEGELPDPVPERVRENPYVAPTVGVHVAKYVPPSRRQEAGSERELTTRIHRQVQGLINRLTESNMLGILGDVERLYREHPRQHVTSTLVDILLGQICDPTALPDTFLILTGGFATAVFKTVGTDFGAYLVQRVVDLFAEHYERATQPSQKDRDVSKETSNLITFISELYSFQLLGCKIVFDYIRMLLETLTELNAELLLRTIRMCGQLLRQDDPLALKDIVALIRPAVAKAGERNISVRTRFMIETINDLKNNRAKAGVSGSAMISEHRTRMKKLLGSLNARKLKSTEPLRVGLKDIQELDKRGKWWLIGASWAGNPGENGTAAEGRPQKSRRNTEGDDDSEGSAAFGLGAGEVPDLSELAREQMMNTDVRRSIFVAVVSAADCEDAYMRLLKLRLSKDRQREIPNVLIQCTGTEQQYNPYYTLISRRVCSDRRIKWAFQDSLWKLFRRLGESIFGGDAGDEEEDAAADMRRLVNVGKMFGSLVASGSLGLTMLKCLNLVYLQSKTRIFVEVLLITVLLEVGRQARTEKTDSDGTLAKILEPVADAPELARGIQWFLKKVVRKTDLACSRAEAEEIKRGCAIADRVLEDMLRAEVVEP